MERVELHTHTKMNQMDGITACEDYIEKAKRYGMTALAFTDHGRVQTFPEAQKYLEVIKDNEFKVLYGMEGYYAPTNDVKEKIYHISILAKNKIGLKNLYKLVSISNLNYFKEKPIILRRILEENREGLLIGSACNMGELYQAIIENKPKEEIEQITNYYDYLEIQPIENNTEFIKKGILKDEKALKDINIKIVELGTMLNKLVVATSDTHFLNKEDKICRKILQAEQGYIETDNQPPLYFRTTKEMLQEFKYLGQEKAYEVVVTNTNKIANMCEKINPISNKKCYPYFPNSEIEIKESAYKGAYKLYGNPLPEKIKERLDKELNSIIKNNFATLYLIAQKLVKKSNEDNYIVGNRASVSASLVAYCIGITEVDPIKYNIPFETFAGIYGDKEPDLVLNFALEYQEKAQNYIKTILGEGTTFKVGQYTSGIIIIPKGQDINEFTPVQYLADDSNLDIITHFNYHALEQSLLKIDILGHNTPTMLHNQQKLTGINPTTIDLEDRKTMKMICSADTLGIPEFETNLVRNIILETKPTTFEELIKILGLSHSTGAWKNNAQDLIKNEIATLKEVIACRDDIMNYLTSIGIEPKVAFEIMEIVRKGKTLKDTENWKRYKDIMRKYNVPEWYIKSCEKILYLFPKGHSTSYAINGFRIAWYKVHYPKEFKATYTSTTDTLLK